MCLNSGQWKVRSTPLGGSWERISWGSNVTLSGISQMEKDKNYLISLSVGYKTKTNKQYNKTHKQKPQTYIYRQQNCGYQG